MAQPPLAGPHHRDQPTLTTLPDEVILHILAHLPPRSLCICMRVNRRIARLAQSQVLWKRVDMRPTAHEEVPPIPPAALRRVALWARGHMQQLVLDGCRGLHDADLAALCPLMPHVRSLSLSSTSAGAATAQALALHCSALRVLRVRRCSRWDDACVRALLPLGNRTGCDTLQVLDLGYTRVSDASLRALGEDGRMASHLLHVDVRFTRCSSAGAAALFQHAHPRYLCLLSCFAVRADALLRALAAAPPAARAVLERLDVRGTALDGWATAVGGTPEGAELGAAVARLPRLQLLMLPALVDWALPPGWTVLGLDRGALYGSPAVAAGEVDLRGANALVHSFAPPLPVQVPRWLERHGHWLEEAGAEDAALAAAAIQVGLET